jgi:septal ring-binding cell division protein DamX
MTDAKPDAETAVAEPQPPVAATSAPVSAPHSAHKSPAPGGKRLVVQLGSFQAEANAQRLTSMLKQKGIADLVVVHDRDRQGHDWYIVRTADFASQEAAEAVAQSIRDAGQADARVMRISMSD